MDRIRIFTILFFIYAPVSAQLKFLIEDFEGFDERSQNLSLHGVYTYGKLKAGVDTKNATGQQYSGNKCLKIEKDGKIDFGGWGKGVTLFMNLDQSTDYFNFYVLQPEGNNPATIRIDLQDDDNEDHLFNEKLDDVWSYTMTVQSKGGWELVSIPLNRFKETSPGGDGGFNIAYYGGKLLGMMISFTDPKALAPKHVFYFDFFCFSKGRLPVAGNLFEPKPADPGDFCSLGAWSDGEGKAANFVEIASSFENLFPDIPGKKLGIVHFFQPFGKDDGSSGLYPSAERINAVIDAGYIPMITLENHFISAGGNKKINLYSITDGHFDSFLGYWAYLIKQVKGTVLLRILHEFNGDWYDWCTVNNDKNPHLVAKAFRYIHNVFNDVGAKNVKYIWCPNSMSVPQEKWNNITDAYPGDDYVDFVALDIYNGAGNNQQIWRSFRKEGIENYFILTQKYPNKPLLICESASREKKSGENVQSKADWIQDMSKTIKTDMSKIRLLAWFNQTQQFRLNSSQQARDAYVRSILKDAYFRRGPNEFRGLIK
jgi:hypothetical protein